MKAAARRPGSHGAGRQARATAQPAGRAAPGLPLLPTGPGPGAAGLGRSGADTR